MFRRRLDLYELNIEGAAYWKKTINPETNEEVYIEIESEPYTLYLDKIGSPKGMPKTTGSYYIDMITGRVFGISESENSITIEPSFVSIQKNHLSKKKDILEKIRKVIETEEDKYIQISEDIIFNSYFCKEISSKENITQIPAKKVEEKIKETRKTYLEDASYYEEFKEPEFSSYDFMCLFCALIATQRNYSFNKDILIKCIKQCKDNHLFTELLGDIKLRNNGIFYYSDNLDETISKLKWSRILYTISPEEDSTIHIFKDIPMGEFIKDRVPYFDTMISFIEKYKTIEFEARSIAYQNMYEQENIDINNLIPGLGGSETIPDYLKDFRYDSDKTLRKH